MKIHFLLLLAFVWAGAARAQTCQTSAELDGLPGKYIDAAHCEYPAMRASWLDDLKTKANITMASKVLTQIEGLEKDSRKAFDLKGAVLKSTFSGRNLTNINRNNIASYDLQLGCYEYICVNKKIMTNNEYATVLRVYVNSFRTLADLTTDAPNVYRINDKQLLAAMNSGIGFYQDVPDDKVKQGSRSVFIMRHWYITRPGQPLLVPANGDGLYKLNPVYFSKDAAGPAKPQLIELSYRYVKVPAGQRLVENFTKNFDFAAVQKMLQ
jgi:hypothetical protein